MTTSAKSFERVFLGLVAVNIVTIGAIVGCLVAARRASERGDAALVSLADEVTRVLQAQAAAERMVAVGRGHLLTHEPELLARAQAAEAKMMRTVRVIASSAAEDDERRRLDPLLASARRYRDAFRAFVSGEDAPEEPREVAASLRRHLIPAREDLVAELDAVAARRLAETEAVRSSARGRRGIAVSLMYAVGVPGVVASMLLTWLAVRSGRELLATCLVLDPTPAGAPLTAGSVSLHRSSRHILSVRPRL